MIFMKYSVAGATSFLSLLALFALLAGQSDPITSVVLAESPALECVADDECESGFCDRRGVCLEPNEACIDSTDCDADAVCNHRNDSCPLEGDRCESQQWGYCNDVPIDMCQADSECGEAELCWVTFARECAPGDEVCEEPGYATCVDFGVLCTERGDECSASQNCVAGRCVVDGFENEAIAIEVDASKEAELRLEWEGGYCVATGRCRADPAGSNGCTVGHGVSTLSFYLFVALVWASRRRVH
jgi:hypothetical protein